MSVSPLMRGRRLRSFRLHEIPEPVRQRAANRLLKQLDDPLDRLAVGRAAHTPSDRVYVVSLDAWQRVMGQ